MAFGLPVEGDDGPFVGERLAEVATCDVHGSVGEARKALDGSGEDVVIVVADGLAVGEVDAEALQEHGDGSTLLEVMRPVPSTVRPSVTVSSVAESGGGSLLVTDSDGHLLGRAVIEVDGHRHHDHEGHDHEGHDHEDHAHEGYEEELASVMQALEERFGGQEPSPAELRAFLRERLLAEGRSPGEADEILDQLEDGTGG